MEAPEIIDVTPENIADEHICCAIGNDKANQARAALKKDWMRERMTEGLVFKKLNVRGKIFIEYIPAECAWKPIDAPDYMAIHCLWVSGKYKSQGWGAKLLETCINDAKAQGKHGVVVVAGTKKIPFLTDKKFFVKYGFETCDTAPPHFELLVRKFADTPTPQFRNSAKALTIDNANGLTFIYSDQCPFTADWVNQLRGIANEYNVPVKVIKLDTLEAAQNAPSAFATFSLFYNGEFITHVIPSHKEFRRIIGKES